MENRFQSRIGQEYDLFLKAVPHFHILQGKISEWIKKYTSKLNNSSIEVIEIGCGTGITTKLICASDPRIHLTAVDNERVMIEQAEKKLKFYLKEERVSFRKEDALEFLKSLPEASFDIFASAFTLHNFDQTYRAEVLNELYRILKKGGLFLNADKYALNDEREHKKSFEWQLKQFHEGFSKIDRPDLIREWVKHYQRDDQKDIIMKESSSIKLMEKIGYQNIEVCYREKMEAMIQATK